MVFRSIKGWIDVEILVGFLRCLERDYVVFDKILGSF